MAEEFIEDIIGNTEPAPKTESEMVAELQAPANEKPAEVVKETEDSKETMGSEATPDGVQPLEKEEVVESDDIKELATQLGWREDHTGPDAVDAKTYILKSKDIQKSMSQYNKDLKNQLQALGGSVEALKKHNESVYRAEVKKLTAEINDLKKERRAAIELADVDKVDELDKQIDEKQKDIDAPKPVDNQEQVVDNPVYDEWVKDNQWYLEDDDMAKFADTVAQQYVGAPPKRIYDAVRRKVQEVFPEKFEGSVNKTTQKQESEVKPPPVGPKSPVERSSAKGTEATFSKADLTSEQLQIMNQFVRGGIMTEEQYINDIAKMQ